MCHKTTFRREKYFGLMHEGEMADIFADIELEGKGRLRRLQVPGDRELLGSAHHPGFLRAHRAVFPQLASTFQLPAVGARAKHLGVRRFYLSGPV